MPSRNLPTAALGTTGMDITRVGFGGWAISGPGWRYTWGQQDDRDSVAAIRHAVEAGVNWVDTAPSYGHGHSEQLVARALRDLPEPDRPYVFTKAGQLLDPHDVSAGPRRVGDPASLRRELEGSLARLGVERVDLLQVHWPAEDGTPLEVYWETFLELQREGKVRAVGLSNHDVAQLEQAEAIGHVDTLQPRFSLLDRDAATDLLPWCADHDTGVLVYSPMESGLLTGAFSEQRAARLDPDDWRAHDPQFHGEQLARNLRLVDTLAEVAARHGVSVAAAAVAWTLAFRGVTGAIVGARQPGQVDGWLPAATMRLEPRDLDGLAATISATGAGSGPTSP